MKLRMQYTSCSRLPKVGKAKEDSQRICITDSSIVDSQESANLLLHQYL